MDGDSQNCDTRMIGEALDGGGPHKSAAIVATPTAMTNKYHPHNTNLRGSGVGHVDCRCSNGGLRRMSETAIVGIMSQVQVPKLLF